MPRLAATVGDAGSRACQRGVFVGGLGGAAHTPVTANAATLTTIPIIDTAWHCGGKSAAAIGCGSAIGTAGVAGVAVRCACGYIANTCVGTAMAPTTSTSGHGRNGRRRQPTPIG